jgi:hypothetical protein
MSILIKLGSVGAKLVHADGQTDITLTVGFRNFANAPKNVRRWVWQYADYAVDWITWKPTFDSRLRHKYLSLHCVKNRCGGPPYQPQKFETGGIFLQIKRKGLELSIPLYLGPRLKLPVLATLLIKRTITGTCRSSESSTTSNMGDNT